MLLYFLGISGFSLDSCLARVVSLSVRFPYSNPATFAKGLREGMRGPEGSRGEPLPNVCDEGGAEGC